MKKIIKIILGIFILTIIGYLGIFFIQNYIIKNNIKEYTYSYEYNVKNIKERGTVRCNWNIFEPEFAEVELENRLDRDVYYISFWKGDIFFKLTKNNWEDHKVGATTIKNTTFPQLLAMVKEDCYQFQKSGSMGIGDRVPIWTYTKAESKEEIEKRKQDRLKQKQEKERKHQEMLNNMTEEERKEYEKEEERLKNRTEEEILRDKGYSEEEIQERLKIEWNEI